MRRSASLAIFIFCSLCLPLLALGQGDAPFVTLNLERQNNFTFATQLDTWYALKKGRYSLDLRLTHTNIFNTSADQSNFVQLYLRSSLWQHYRLNQRLSLASWLETDQYFSSRNQKINLYAGVRYRPYPFLTVTPLLGYALDERTAILGQSSPAPRLDHGFTPALLLESFHNFGDDLSTETKLFARYKFIDPRRQYDLTLDHSWAKKFQEGVTLNVGARLGSHELDDYQANSVKRIISDSASARLGLTYEFSPGVEWRSNNNLLLFSRDFRFENQVAETPEENNLTFEGLEILSSQRLSVTRGKWRAFALYEYFYSSRQYDLENNLGLNETDFIGRLESEQQKDFLRNQHKIDLLCNAQLSKRQSLTFKVTNQYLRFDTPSDLNFDDRDELSWVGAAEWMMRWRKNFYTALNVSGNFRHYAFLFAEKSQDNYKQRSLRLDFRYGWDITPKLRIDGDNAVYVTYNVKDFTDYNLTDRSTRNLETNLHAAYRPTRNLEVDAGYRRKETHNSYLNWAAFTETTLDTNVIRTIHGKFRRYFDLKERQVRLYAEGGYKHFDQVRRNRASMIGLDNLLKTIALRQITSQTGPLVTVGLRDRRQSSIDLGVWMQAQVRRNRFEELNSQSILGQAFYEEDLQVATVEFRPFVTIRLNYFFRPSATR
ncbi:MAG: hypothetical protein AAGN35_25915 [Bacteroidota bacterium]